MNETSIQNPKTNKMLCPCWYMCLCVRVLLVVQTRATRAEKGQNSNLHETNGLQNFLTSRVSASSKVKVNNECIDQSVGGCTFKALCICYLFLNAHPSPSSNEIAFTNYKIYSIVYCTQLLYFYMVLEISFGRLVTDCFGKR